MIDLLKRELPSHYKLHRTIVDVPCEITAEEHFDLTDRGLTSIVDYKTGNISFDHSNRTEVQVINYEAYLIGLKGTKFETGRKRCDFILHETVAVDTPHFSAIVFKDTIESSRYFFQTLLCMTCCLAA